MRHHIDRNDESLRVRLESMTFPDPNSGCWLFTGVLDFKGYGHIRSGKRTLKAHRAAYVLRFGPIPDDLELDHKCQVRCCINPNHLEAVSHKENVARGRATGPKPDKTHCKNGHQYTPDNLYVSSRSNGRATRACRTCALSATRRWRAKA